jgi:hypothetical protein
MRSEPSQFELKQNETYTINIIDINRPDPIRHDSIRNETNRENTMILFVIALIVTVFLATSVGWAIFTWSYTKDLRDEIERLQWELGAGVPKGR